ncbi:D-glycero-alpha-D-manno-heptose-1,7-bisphosphate 7-phosphatase [Halalkalibacterium ligniniphilum]|uniref:D-glycero-alpha-D-manno-heptose-1,7-bisphosphate 7-phosphatase n=1 Tax=Halalkalibacterium ligniniphilum TaxID=1134413 RepID=UPI000345D69C|nr:HAD family hydrolase [Halalkalibacterium ligniniphilum]
MRPAVFLDRDGVLNIDYGYVYKTKDFKWVKGAKTAIKQLKKLGYYIFVVTNQSGVARGYYKEKEVIALHKYINNQLLQNNAWIDKFYYCPHHPNATIEKYRVTCKCRKPESGMIEKAIFEWEIDIKNSFLIGDNRSDSVAAENLGINGYLFTQGNLLEFVNSVLKNFQENNSFKI